eukprot:CAMPEP_0175095974 /NCGR_PEP_ID=MMETSP0086_2-20121207/4467_1 /TAXON_ID=136419 /ORGANISM="Unknown Unknown, Strain D1" /LENGTH=36 /DNA_ID= /DNA_START= /DNA_END= /DNA_ORIENTATION=
MTIVVDDSTPVLKGLQLKPDAPVSGRSEPCPCVFHS